MADKHSNIKHYPFNQSPFYKLQSRKKLASLFGMSLKELESLTSRHDNYNIFTVDKDIDRPRKVEVPKPRLERLHRRVFNLLTRITPPEYLHSGVKGRSYITNANQHIGAKHLLKLDIRKFFPSTLGWHVHQFFHEVMGCSRDVAGLLSTICTCDSHVPTGSCLSQVVAFYAHYDMFEEIYSLAVQRGLTMTCYVDDIAISGDEANRKLLYEVRGIIRRRGLMSPRKKEFVYSPMQHKVVTGSVVTDTGLLLPNHKHKKIHNEVNTLLSMPDGHEKLTLLNKTLGRVISATQSDRMFNARRRALINERNRLLKDERA